MDALARSEQEKYRRFRALKRKPPGSPGLRLAPRAWKMFGRPAEGSLVDYGCGECAAVDWFRRKGLDVTGVDLVAVRSDVVEACLWSMGPEVPEADYAFSADVLEHLPPDRIHAALRGIREKTRQAGVFQIATRPDTSGKLIGETLHLTVRPGEWWWETLHQHWVSVSAARHGNGWQWVFYVRGDA